MRHYNGSKIRELLTIMMFQHLNKSKKYETNLLTKYLAYCQMVSRNPGQIVLAIS